MELTEREKELKRALLRKYSKTYRDKHKERILEYYRKYRAEHKEEIREYKKRYREKMRGKEIHEQNNIGR